MGNHSREESKSNSTKKPITKKWWFWTLVAFVVIGVIGNLAGLGPEQGVSEQLQSSASSTTSTTAAAEKTTEPATESAETAPAPTSAIPFDVTFSNSFHNDVTGKWRKALVATSTTIDEYAVDYYREYFQSDDEVHVIYNFTMNTVNTLTVQSGTLFVSVTEYVKGEEHDAKKACGGEYYGQYQFDLSTGELTFSTFE